MDADMRRALVERSDLIEARASAVLDEALIGKQLNRETLDYQCQLMIASVNKCGIDFT
jgi:hypothetical protein